MADAALDRRVTDAGTNPLTNAPVTFAVGQGSALISASSAGTTGDTLQLRSDANGLAAVWLQLPLVMSGNVVTVSAPSGTNTAQTGFYEIARTPGEISMMAVGGARIMELTTSGDVISWGKNPYGESETTPILTAPIRFTWLD